MAGTKMEARTTMYAKTDQEVRQAKVAQAQHLIAQGYNVTSKAEGNWSFRLIKEKMVVTAWVAGGGFFPEELTL